MPTAAGLLFSFFLMGLTHAFEVDHLSAVSGFVTRSPKAWPALIHGIRWALGHGASLLLMGTTLFLFRMTLSQSQQNVLEGGVGLGMVLIGAICIRDAWRNPQHNLPHTDHEHKGSFRMGLFHGAAGTGAVIGQVIALGGFGQYRFILGSVFAFSLGVLIAMSIYAFILGQGICFGVTRAKRLHCITTALVGLWTLGLGSAWIAKSIFS